MKLNVPNALTLLRLTLIPVFVVVFCVPLGQWGNVLATVVFVFAALTDMLDGYMARRLGQTSSFGAFLDPVADKLMIAVALVLLVERNPSLWLSLPAAVIIGREIAVSALREWMASLGGKNGLPVSLLGKVKTTSQMLALSCLIWELPLFGFPVYQAGMVLLYLSAVLTLWSMSQYLCRAWPDMQC